MNRYEPPRLLPDWTDRPLRLVAAAAAVLAFTGAALTAGPGNWAGASQLTPVQQGMRHVTLPQVVIVGRRAVPDAGSPVSVRMDDAVRCAVNTVRATGQDPANDGNLHP